MGSSGVGYVSSPFLDLDSKVEGAAVVDGEVVVRARAAVLGVGPYPGKEPITRMDSSLGPCPILQPCPRRHDLSTRAPSGFGTVVTLKGNSGSIQVQPTGKEGQGWGTEPRL